MSRYSEQFKRDAVALYENNEDLSLNAASAQLGINRASATFMGQEVRHRKACAHKSCA
nr:hypothetical protein HMPREF0276_0518 [Corynebacterium accolens ATCC 49725]